MQKYELELIQSVFKCYYLKWDAEAERLSPAEARVITGKTRLHFPNLVDMSKTYPLSSEDLRTVAITAAVGHDLGRVEQFKNTGNFSDNIKDINQDALNPCDHHYLGYKNFPAIVKNALGHIYSETELDHMIDFDEDLVAIRAAMALHGYVGLVGKNARVTKLWNSLNEKQKEVARMATQLDDAENMVRCLTYVLTEQHEHAKSVLKGGFIADKDLTGVPKYYLDQFLQGKKLDRYDKKVSASEKTYASYLLVQLSLGTSDRINSEIMRSLLGEKKPVYYYDEEGKIVEDWSMTYLEGIKFAFEYLKTPPEQIMSILKYVMAGV